MLFIEYPKCSTCKRAKAFLDKKSLKYKERNIVLENPKEEELDLWIKNSKKDINKFFNTSGLKYRELNLKDKIKNMSYEEKLKLLSTDGMLVKRPILVLVDKIFVGFNEKEWENV